LACTHCTTASRGDAGTADKTSSIRTTLVKPFIKVFLYEIIILEERIGFANAIDLFVLSR
jgi:hypothetical protein